jgi:cell division septal protein FtsQ
MSVKRSSAGQSSSVARGSERLGERRRQGRRRVRIALIILLLLLLGATLYALHQPFARISHVQVFGAEESLADIAFDAMRGSYLGTIPRDSTLFYPADQIRSDILARDSNIAAVSLFRSGLRSLTVRVDMRVPIAQWCGLSPTPDVGEYCYVFDSSGLIYAAADLAPDTLNSFALYSPLVGATEEPLQATISQSEKLPATFDFARQISSLGSNVTKIVIQNGEVSDILSSGTRVTYVLGNEQNAFTALSSARDSFKLDDGSIEYIDLRFDGKVYLKRKGDTVE